MAERWSNDYYKSTWHRVNNNTGKLRHSIPFFCNLDYYAKVDPKSSVCDISKKKHLIGKCSTKYNESIFAGDYICSKLGLMYDSARPTTTAKPVDADADAAAADDDDSELVNEKEKD